MPKKSAQPQPSVKTSPWFTLIEVPAEAKGVGVLFVYLAVTFFATHVNTSGTVLDYKNLPDQFQLIDKVFHFCAYFGLTFLVLFCFTLPVEGRCKRVRVSSAKRLLIWCIFVLVYGMFDELTQPFFGRRFEVLDLIANCLGIAVGQLAFVICEASGFRDKLRKMM